VITTALDGMGRWVYGLDHNGDRGKVKRLKNTNSPLALTGPVAGDCDCADLPCSLRSGTVLRESGGQTRTLSPSVRLTRTAAKNRGHTRRQETGR
jgi:hypothetical protein